MPVKLLKIRWTNEKRTGCFEAIRNHCGRSIRVRETLMRTRENTELLSQPTDWKMNRLLITLMKRISNQWWSEWEGKNGTEHNKERYENGANGWRQRYRETATDRETETHRVTHREKERQTERETDLHRDTQKNRERETVQRVRERVRERET